MAKYTRYTIYDFLIYVGTLTGKLKPLCFGALFSRSNEIRLESLTLSDTQMPRRRYSRRLRPQPRGRAPRAPCPSPKASSNTLSGSTSCWRAATGRRPRDMLRARRIDCSSISTHSSNSKVSARPSHSHIISRSRAQCALRCESAFGLTQAPASSRCRFVDADLRRCRRRRLLPLLRRDRHAVRAAGSRRTPVSRVRTRCASPRTLRRSPLLAH